MYFVLSERRAQHGVPETVGVSRDTNGIDSYLTTLTMTVGECSWIGSSSLHVVYADVTKTHFSMKRTRLGSSVDLNI